MSLHEWWSLLFQQITETSWLEWLAVSLGIAEVLYAKTNKIWLYPTGIAGTLLTIYLFFMAGLYAEGLLNGYYVIMSVYGWWYWIKKKDLPPVKITYCNRKEWLAIVGIVTGSFIILYLLLKNFTPSTVPFWDAWISATAWAGMWLLAKRKIENWILLNISNAFAIPILFYKHLLLYSGLTIFLFVVAIQGYFTWRNITRKENIISFTTAAA
ncbi:MAG: nicotinamide riboside transporter PnuC [Bacteroidota bacterium]|jgi:nicotinamide mononucleotide transporter|nr:nicotinamide riboside transporter PnuC [Bacteroidota bacterium]